MFSLECQQKTPGSKRNREFYYAVKSPEEELHLLNGSLYCSAKQEEAGQGGLIGRKPLQKAARCDMLEAGHQQNQPFIAVRDEKGIRKNETCLFCENDGEIGLVCGSGRKADRYGLAETRRCGGQSTGLL